MRRALELLGSLRLTLGLFLALAALFAVGLGVPQKALLQRELYEGWRAQHPSLVSFLELFGLTDVHASPLAAATWALFFLNLAVVMARRVPGTLRRVRIDGDVPDPATAPGFSGRARVEAAAPDLAAVRAFFAGRGYAVHEAGGRLRAVRHRLSPVATLGFHLSFFLVAAGAAVSVATRFEGNVDLGEGEAFTGELAQYTSRPRLPRFGGAPATRFLVEGIEPEVVGNVPVGLRVHVRDAGYRLRTLEVNRPYEVDGTSFVFKNLGVAPALVLVDSTGRELFAGYMRLNVLQGRSDRFSLRGLELTAELFPDYVRDADGEWSRSQEMRDPVLRLTAKAPSGRTFTASLRPGGTMPLGPYTLTFVDWRYWVRLYVRSERGLWLLWLGFATGAAALTWRLGFYRRELVAAVAEDGGAIVLAGRAEYYRALFSDEVEKVARELRKELGAMAPGDRRLVDPGDP